LVWTKPDEYVFNQKTTDIEHTWLALYALRIAREHDQLPAEITHTLPGPRGTMREVTVSVVNLLHDACRALVARQDPSGVFPEINLHQPVTDFDEIEGIAGVPIDPESFPELEQPLSLIATAQGLAALDQIRLLLGMDAIRPYAAAMAKAKRMLDRKVDTVKEGEREVLGNTSLDRYALYLALRNQGPPMVHSPDDLLAKSVSHLIFLQRKNGTWPAIQKEDAWLPTVWRARSKVLPRPPKDDFSIEMRRAFVLMQLNDHGHAWTWQYRAGYIMPEPTMTTAAALLVLEAYLTNHQG
jgi:hypothetical protein